MPKISEKDRKRQQRSLGVFMKGCLIWRIVPVGQICVSWSSGAQWSAVERSGVQWSTVERWSRTRQPWGLLRPLAGSV